MTRSPLILPDDDATLGQTLAVLAHRERLHRRRFLTALGGMAAAATHRLDWRAR